MIRSRRRPLPPMGNNEAPREHAEKTGTRWRDWFALLLGPYCIVCLKDWPCPTEMEHRAAAKETANG